MDVTIDDLSPIADPRASSPSRLNLFQDTVTNGPLTKHSHTEQVMMMHTLKTKLSKYQNFIDKAFEHIAQGSDEQIIEGCTIVAKVMTKAWMFPKISHDLSYALCDYLRDQTYFDSLIMNFIKAQTCEPVRLACGRVLEECLSLNNREYVVNKGYLKKLVATAEKLNKNPEQQRMSLSIMESLFKHSTATTYRLIEYGVLDHILLTCKRATETPITLRHAALALANLSLYSCSEAKKKIIQKKVPDWLFLLASQPDDITRYYACLAICMLGSTKEMEAAVNKSGTLALVEPFLLAHQAITFAGDHYKHSQGRPKEWLERLLPMLKSKCREARSIAAFHFTMEATIKKDQQKLEVFQSSFFSGKTAGESLAEKTKPPHIHKFFKKYQIILLKPIIGRKKLLDEISLYSFSQHYGIFDVWSFTNSIRKQDSLIEIGAIAALKELASSPDEVAAKFASEALTIIGEEVPYKLTQQVPCWTIADVQYWVKKIGFESYADAFAKHMVDGDLLLLLTEKELEQDLQMSSALLRKRFIRELESLKIAADYGSVDESQLDQFLMSLSPELSVYTYQMLGMGLNRNLLPSLTDEMMKTVFIDVDKLYAGKFDSSLLKNIQAAKHFILVLTPNSLDRLFNDHNCEDWIHKELRCAFDHHKNVIPIFDQHFDFPADTDLPADIRHITRYNGVRWVHDYQEACMDKVERFIKGELNRTPSIGQQQASVTSSTSNGTQQRKISARWSIAKTTQKCSVTRQQHNEISNNRCMVIFLK
ncbi:hypothetical protein X798_03401 [Onchocerca flexuosa]|uniref:ADP-ribosyl cyclase/cyclic ADP-ribose hydrolase n=1 Tax=Onchocerca flexuosa TaxID=387005 RepID=A0A238BXF2_9BILA|nr:hypothetical protein X798_03401 [Onchocerca flexuosa]